MSLLRAVCAAVIVVALVHGEDIDVVRSQLRSDDAKTRRQAIGVLRSLSPNPELAGDLVASLRDEDRTVRRIAAEALGKFRTDGGAVVEDLAIALGDPDRDVRNAAAGALGSIGAGSAPAVPLLIDIGLDPEFENEVATILALGRIGPAASEAVPHLASLLSSERAEIRAAVLRALPELGDAAIPMVRPAAEALADSTMSVREAAAEALYRFGPKAKAAVGALTFALTDEANSPIVQTHAAYALGMMAPDSKTAVPALARSLRSPYKQVRGAAGWALSVVDPRPGITPEKVNELIDKFEREHQQDSRRVAGTRPPDDVATLIEQLAEAEPRQRRDAARALREIGPRARDAAPALGRLLGDGERYVSSAAARALEAMGGAAVPVLVASLSDPNGAARSQALSSLRRMGELARPALPQLAKIVAAGQGENAKVALEAILNTRSGSPDVVAAAMKAAAEPELAKLAFQVIGWSGPHGSPAVPLLVGALDHEDYFVREAATGSLAQIGSEAASAVPVMIDLYRSNRHASRELIIRSLPHIDPASEAATAFLVDVLSSSVEEFQMAACDALRGMSAVPVEAAPKIVLLLDAGQSDVRRAAVLAMAEFEWEVASPAIPRLLQILAEDQQEVRRAAAGALAGLDSEGTTAVPALIEALGDPAPRVREAAAFGLAGIAEHASAALPALQDLAESDPIRCVRGNALFAARMIAKDPAVCCALPPRCE